MVKIINSYKRWHTELSSSVSERVSYAKKENTPLPYIHLAGDQDKCKMERLNGQIRDREKIMRGIKKSDTVIILTCYQLYHNYFGAQEGLISKNSGRSHASG